MVRGQSVGVKDAPEGVGSREEAFCEFGERVALVVDEAVFVSEQERMLSEEGEARDMEDVVEDGEGGELWGVD